MSANQEVKPFDIHQKLKNSKYPWSYMHSVGSHQCDAGYEFRTIFLDEMEHAIYERHGNYFVLIDFFKNYDEACDEAKSIIDDNPDLKKLFKH
ncbi:hypothetical protein GHT41_07870 [Citrobacter koseri]|uniref:hypothetical protein n=1 Tax=Citrobacter koseri TaxID=545 RepID=UPI0019037677|nr:hypothetical protein [Citrobacter koseri]MBJ9353578.1 hypothetical protein [Citrobacter koseri]